MRNMPVTSKYEVVPESDGTVVASPSSSKLPVGGEDEKGMRVGSYDEEDEGSGSEAGSFRKPRRYHHIGDHDNEQLVTREDDFTEAEERKVLKKLDRRVVLFVALLYLLSFLDRSNIGNARIAGLERDLRLTGEQYEWLLTAFYICYILFEWMALLYVFLSFAPFRGNVQRVCSFVC